MMPIDFSEAERDSRSRRQPGRRLRRVFSSRVAPQLCRRIGWLRAACEARGHAVRFAVFEQCDLAPPLRSPDLRRAARRLGGRRASTNKLAAARRVRRLVLGCARPAPPTRSSSRVAGVDRMISEPALDRLTAMFQERRQRNPLR
jgi:hypothetical protein